MRKPALELGLGWCFSLACLLILVGIQLGFPPEPGAEEDGDSCGSAENRLQQQAPCTRVEVTKNHTSSRDTMRISPRAVDYSGGRERYLTSVWLSSESLNELDVHSHTGRNSIQEFVGHGASWRT